MGPGRALPVPAKLFQPHVVSDSPQLPWNIGIIDILEVVLINPGDVDPSGVATVATSPPAPASSASREVFANSH